MSEKYLLSTPKRLLIALIPAVLFIIARYGHSFIINNDIKTCFFRGITGRPCVFCGLSHAFASAAHGHWKQAFGYHPYWWVPALLIVLVCTVYAMGLGQKSLTWFIKTKWWALVAAVIILSFVRAYL